MQSARQEVAIAIIIIPFLYQVVRILVIRFDNCYCFMYEFIAIALSIGSNKGYVPSRYKPSNTAYK
jgi:hypothetical protein